VVGVAAVWRVCGFCGLSSFLLENNLEFNLKLDFLKLLSAKLRLLTKTVLFKYFSIVYCEGFFWSKFLGKTAWKRKNV
jgi:hypothetical protein